MTSMICRWVITGVWVRSCGDAVTVVNGRPSSRGERCCGFAGGRRHGTSAVNLQWMQDYPDCKNSQIDAPDLEPLSAYQEAGHGSCPGRHRCPLEDTEEPLTDPAEA